MLAVIDGPMTDPVIELHFTFDATDRSGVLLRDWVKSLPGSSWDPARHAWVLTRDPGPGALERAGFTVVTPDDEPAESQHFACPLLALGREGTVTVHARLSDPDPITTVVGSDAVRLGERSWSLPVSRCGSLRAALPHCLNLLPFDGLPDGAPVVHPAPDRTLTFDGTLEGLRGVPLTDLDAPNPVTIDGLAQMGVTNVEALLHMVPRRYLDRSNPVPLSTCAVGETTTLLATVTSVKPSVTRHGATRVEVTDTSDGTRLTLTWFNAAWIARRFSPGMTLLVHGKLGDFRGRPQMVSPVVDIIAESDATTATPIIGVYPSSEKHKVSTWHVRHAVAEAATRFPATMVDPVPQGVLDRLGLPGRRDALVGVHEPSTMDQALHARNRIAFDELFRWQLILAGQRHDTTAAPGIAHQIDPGVRDQLTQSLPYPLTGAQARALTQIENDLRGPHPMSRLLQGEVGSGKTVVLAAAMLDVCSAGAQAALMAPTESLAAQHFTDLQAMMRDVRLPDGSGVTVEMLTTKVTGKDRKRVLAGLADGTVHVVVGTQALLGDKVDYHRLGLVVIDEQHRFGVEQRGHLVDKARLRGWSPDVLVATATPVPRTAVLTTFGDLAISVLDELPPGRSPITTRLTRRDDLDRADGDTWSLVRQQVAAGRQAFVVTPVVADSEAKAARGAQTMRDHVAAMLPGISVGLAHGKQTPIERGGVMGAFTAGELDVLVATTVIEVGVNVPNATVIVITGADQFGVAQLHQLRGRVGRGCHPGTAVLVPSGTREAMNPATVERLEMVRDSTDGFALAEADLRARGTGSLTGTRQSGRAGDLRVANLLEDTELVVAARQAAAELIESDPNLARHPLLRVEIASVVGADATWLATI